MNRMLRVLLLLLGVGSAAIPQSMRIHTAGGVAEFPLADIDSITFAIAPTYADSDITSGLALWFPFDGNILDGSGNGNHGTSGAAAYVSDKWGNASSAFKFNGLDNFISVPNSPSINPANQVTLCFWLRVDQIMDNYMPVVTKGGEVWDYFANREYGVWAKQNFTLWYPQFMAAGDSLGQHELISGNLSFAVGEWNYFVFIVDRISHKMTMYADGVLTNQINDSYSTFNVNTDDLLVGWDAENLAEHSPLNGAMDNLRIYTRALSPQQIMYLYTTHQ